MKLQNVLPHMAGSSVLVNGHQYELDAQGVTLSEVTAEDAQKLLANRAAWRLVAERQAVVERQVVAEPVAVPPAPPERPVTVPDGREPLPVPEIKAPVGKIKRK